MRSLFVCQLDNTGIGHLRIRISSGCLKRAVRDVLRGGGLALPPAEEYYSNPSAKKLFARLTGTYLVHILVGLSECIECIECDQLGQYQDGRGTGAGSLAIGQRLFRRTKTRSEGKCCLGLL